MNDNLPNALPIENTLFVYDAKLEEPIYCEREQVIAVSSRSRYNKKLKYICITVMFIELALVVTIIVIYAMNMFIVN